jgi:ketosteroid isomerase-like protein
MKRNRGSSDTYTVVMVALFVVVAALALAACGGSSKSGGTASTAAPFATASPTSTPSAVSDPAQVARTGAVVKAFMTTWNSAWSAKRDRDALSSLYSDDVMYYDTTVGVITKSDMDAMGKDPSWWKSFRLKLKSFFVSPDGRFAAILGRIAIRDDAGNLPWQPAASVHAFANDKIVWEYDYYGGEPSKSKQTEPMLTISRSAAAAGSPAAKAAVAASTATIQRWLVAFNGRDATTFLSFYAEKARYVDVVSPRWRVMSKSQLAADVASRFPTSEFASKLEPEPESPMDAGFFVSADGRLAAVQGTYADETAGGSLVDQPMLVILELKDGEIVRQYDYMAVDRSALRP